MAENTVDPTETVDTVDTTTQGNTIDSIEPDWKAKYEDMVKHSRDWEKRAKQNYEAVQQVEKLTAEHAELSQKARQADELKTQLEQMKARQELRELKATLASELNIPDVLLPDGTEEDMREFASKLTQWAQSRPQLPLSDQSTYPTHAHQNNEIMEFERKLLGL